MAKLGFRCVASGKIALGTSTKVLTRIVAPADQDVLVKRIRTQGFGTNPSGEPDSWQFIIGPTGGSGVSAGTAGSNITPTKTDESKATAVRTAHAEYSADPTIGAACKTAAKWGHHPQQGYVYSGEILIPAGYTGVLKVTSAAAHNGEYEIEAEE